MTKSLTYLERAALCEHPLARRLFASMDQKKSNLSVSADVTRSDELLHLAETIGPEMVVLKTHVDILTDFTVGFTETLQKIAKHHQFLIFEDRKFADIGNTVKHQYQDGMYHIADWADMVNAHSLPGSGIVSGLMEVGLKKQRGLLLLAEMSSAGNLITSDYTKATLAMAEQFPEFVLGFISQKKLSDDPRWMYMTPGVQLAAGKDALGQQYVTPLSAIRDHQTDIIIVGRGILQAADPLSEAKKYREAGWAAYMARL